MKCFESLEPRRLMAAGDLDTSFGTNGMVAAGTAVEVLVDGKILTARTIFDPVNGQHPETRNWTFAVQRFLPGGAPDLSFGDAGTVTVNAGTHFKVTEVVA